MTEASLSPTIITALVDEDHKFGPAMKALSPKARAFVMALVELGGRDMDRAALMAGYTGTKPSLQVTASRLAADTRVQEALVEEAKALARASGLSAVATMVSIMEDATAGKNYRLQAATAIARLATIEPDKNVNVNHTVDIRPTTKEQINQVITLAKEVGMDPRKLLGKAGVIVDAEFTVTQDATGLEDLL